MFTGDGAGFDTSAPTGLSFRLYALVTTLPPVPGTPNFVEILHQAEETERSNTGLVVVRKRLALFDITQYAVRVALASDFLKASHGCVLLPTEAELRAFEAAEGVVPSHETVGGEVQPAVMGAEEHPPIAEVPASHSDGLGAQTGEGTGARSSPTPTTDDDALVTSFTTAHHNYEVRAMVAPFLFAPGWVACAAMFHVTKFYLRKSALHVPPNIRGSRGTQQTSACT